MTKPTKKAKAKKEAEQSFSERSKNFTEEEDAFLAWASVKLS